MSTPGGAVVRKSARATQKPVEFWNSGEQRKQLDKRNVERATAEEALVMQPSSLSPSSRRELRLWEPCTDDTLMARALSRLATAAPNLARQRHE